ncbi:UNVERIFIED_CONTAM: hypothetical protein HDU68_000683 [Siphonaria sp. JEL0065]|nr:hypothetical protein HDU68_000683 [Siphonaria sp. JEL0065]
MVKGGVLGLVHDHAPSCIQTAFDASVNITSLHSLSQFCKGAPNTFTRLVKNINLACSAADATANDTLSLMNMIPTGCTPVPQASVSNYTFAVVDGQLQTLNGGVFITNPTVSTTTTQITKQTESNEPKDRKMWMWILLAGLCILAVVAGSILFLTFSTRSKKKGGKKAPVGHLLFRLKKGAYLLSLLIANVGFAVIVYYYCGSPGLLWTFIVMKSKDIIMTTANIFALIFWFIKYKVLCFQVPKIDIAPCCIASLIPAYSEPRDQIDITTKSLIANVIGQNKQLIMIVCDGIDVAVQEDLTTVLEVCQSSYVSWKKKSIPVTITYGLRDRTPVVIVKKGKNQGKKDTLILGHDIFNVHRKSISPAGLVMKQEVLAKIEALYGMSDFKYLFCTDADSDISSNSFMDLIETIERSGAVAACGLVVIDFAGRWWNFWNLFQCFQYLFGQLVRRSCENLYGKVSCLPGCISMFKVSPISSPALDMYAALPHETDLFLNIVQQLGTDRRLASSFLQQGKDVVTKYDPRARCHTIPPSTLVTYLSQRRRWGSNSYFNTWCNNFAPNIHPFMRFFGLLDSIRMSLQFLRTFNILVFIILISTSTAHIREYIPLLCVLAYPLVFFFACVLVDSFCRPMFGWIFLGWICNRVAGLLVTLMIISNVFWNMGSIAWGGNQKEAVQDDSKETLLDIDGDGDSAVSSALTDSTEKRFLVA